MALATTPQERIDPPARDRDAWIAAAMADHTALLQRIAAARVGPDLAADVVAETFATAWRRLETFDPNRGSEQAWLIGMTVRACDQHRRAERRWLRRQVRLGARYAPATVDTSGDADARVDASASSTRLWKAIARLNRDERTVLLLVAHADLTPTEVADALGEPAATIRSRLLRARRRVAADLGGSLDIGDQS